MKLAFSDSYFDPITLEEQKDIERALKKHLDAQENAPNVSVTIIIAHEKSADSKRKVYLVLPPILNEKQRKDKDIRFNDTVDVSEVVDWLWAHIANYLTQTSCAHQWGPSEDPYGQVYPDGRGVCKKCGLPAYHVCEKDPKVKVISMYRECDVVATSHWPEGVRLQGGERGVVITKSKDTPNYTTAFVEAFFHAAGGVGTYVRGEGDNAAEAEKQAWQKAEPMLRCQSHQWDRNVNGIHRKDGYARCIHCDVKGTVLEPETRCVVCNKPTSDQLGKDTLCLVDRFALTVDEFIARQGIVKGLFGEVINENKDQERINFMIRKTIFQHLGEERYKNNREVVSRVLIKVEGQLLEMLHGDEFAKFQDGDSAKPVTLALLKSFEKQVEAVFEGLV